LDTNVHINHERIPDSYNENSTVMLGRFCGVVCFLSRKEAPQSELELLHYLSVEITSFTLAFSHLRAWEAISLSPRLKNQC